MAPLQRAFPLAQVDQVAVLVAQDLDLDVARILDQLLDIHLAAAEGALGFARCVADSGLQFVFVIQRRRMPLPPPPAAALSSTG